MQIFVVLFLKNGTFLNTHTATSIQIYWTGVQYQANSHRTGFRCFSHSPTEDATVLPKSSVLCTRCTSPGSANLGNFSNKIHADFSALSPTSRSRVCRVPQNCVYSSSTDGECSLATIGCLLQFQPMQEIIASILIIIQFLKDKQWNIISYIFKTTKIRVLYRISSIHHVRETSQNIWNHQALFEKKWNTRNHQESTLKPATSNSSQELFYGGLRKQNSLGPVIIQLPSGKLT